jgi:hypothetical protein
MNTPTEANEAHQELRASDVPSEAVLQEREAMGSLAILFQTHGRKVPGFLVNNSRWRNYALERGWIKRPDRWAPYYVPDGALKAYLEEAL